MKEGRDRPKGENYVWFTGMGLGLGLLMVVFLLGVIFVNGIAVFWPSEVLEVRVEEGVGPQGAEVFAGAVTMDRMAKDLREGGDGYRRELQFFVGNKDVYGFMFLFVEAAGIVEMKPAEGLMEIERREWGDALGYPARLEFADGESLAVDQAGFRSRLRELVDEATDRRGRIRRIEKGSIGSINRRMTDYRVEQRALERRLGEEEARGTGRYAEIESRMATLQKEYDVLAAEARALRDAQEAVRFVYTLPTGGEQAIPIGDVMHFYFPNEMGFLDKVGFFVNQVWRFVSENPREANTEGGIFPAIFGTFVMTLLMSVAVMPFGVLAAIYLREYAKQGVFVRAVRIGINNLAGVPSIVFGVFGLGFFVYVLGGSIDDLFFSDRLPTPTFGTGGILWASLTLALLTVPVVVVATEEALAAVPRGMREASLACGASKWQTIQRIVLPSSAPGMLTGLVLAMARGAGEVAPLMLVGVVKLAPSLPIDGEFPYVHLERKFMHLGFHIYDLGFQSPDSEAAKPMVFATSLLLITLVVVLNLAAIIVRNRLRKRYQAAAF